MRSDRTGSALQTPETISLGCVCYYFELRIDSSHRDETTELEMDDLYAINAAKSEFREGFNLADPSRMLAIADPDLVNFSEVSRVLCDC